MNSRKILSRFGPVEKLVTMTTRTVCSSRWESDARCWMIWRTAQQTPVKVLLLMYTNSISSEEVKANLNYGRHNRVMKLTQTWWWKIYAITRHAFICLSCYNVLKPLYNIWRSSGMQESGQITIKTTDVSDTAHTNMERINSSTSICFLRL